MPSALHLKLRAWAFLLFLCSAIIPARAGGEWISTLSRDSPGDFPDLRPLRASYAFSWAGITAGTADVYFHRDGDADVLEGKGRSIGLARVLWKYDVNYRSAIDARSLRPREVHQLEMERAKRIETTVKYSGTGATSTRTELNRPSRTKNFALENLNDLQSALFYLRSQPLRDHSVFRVAVYPADSAYIATVTVVGRDHLKVHAGSYSAIKLDLQLKKVNKKNELEPHKKFKRAQAWVSDDDDRLLLRIEGQILVGTVVTELQSARFEK